MKHVIRLILILLIAAGWYANEAWKELQPTLEVLKEKDPEKYELMVEEAKSFHLPTAKKLYEELDRMTWGQVIALRYNKWKEKVRADEDFRFEDWQEELDQREATKEEKKQEYHGRANRLLAARADIDGKIMLAAWEKMEPWQKGLVLREKCIKFTEMEKKRSLRRRNINDLSRIEVLLDKPDKRSWSVPELCESLVPHTRDEPMVNQAIERLKSKMNYYYFVRLLDEIGIPRDKIVPFSTRLRQVALDFSDS
ncbi:MAG: hypothetical protein V3U37_05835 [Nitrospinaceae bacterium]